MDPNTALAAARKAAQEILSGDVSDAVIELVRAVAALDAHLSRGGYLPGDWSVEPDYETIVTTVPVSVVVDIANDRVTKVVVHDDNPGDFTFWPDPDDDYIEAKNRFRRAVNVADAATWPHWQFGW